MDPHEIVGPLNPLLLTLRDGSISVCWWTEEMKDFDFCKRGWRVSVLFVNRHKCVSGRIAVFSMN